MKNNLDDIYRGIENAYIDSALQGNVAYSPQFLKNDHISGSKVLSYIENELQHCDEFSISVAFINRGGFEVIASALKELERKGIHGRILTTDYLMFSDPYALDRLSGLKNIKLKMFLEEEAGIGFHTKGYIFRKDGVYKIVIGSSNMTQKALTTNMEWNTALVSTDQGAMAQAIVKEFEKLWNDEAAKDYDEISEFYRKQYNRKKQIDKLIKSQHIIALENEIVDFETFKLEPNEMQKEFIGNIHELIEKGAKRALLISATGDGGIIVPSQAKTA